jgi:hypothetical protein
MSPRISILGLVFLLAATAYAQEFKCPSSHGKKLLVNTAVFDGPPKNMFELEPDDSGGKKSYTWASWDVSDLFKSGRTLFLTCWYGSLKDPEIVTIQADKPVQKCVFRTHGAGLPAEMICK